MRLGIDFDNTIISYDAVFRACVADKGWLLSVPQDKAGIRDGLREQEDGELRWQQLQAEVYGTAIMRAPPAPGVVQALHDLRAGGCSLFLVSHKTEHAAANPQCNLREAAKKWLRGYKLAGAEPAPFPEDRVYFEATRKAKLARIARLKCDMFVDDLPEVLTDPDFPNACERVCFVPAGRPVEHGSLITLRRWHDIGALVHGR